MILQALFNLRPNAKWRWVGEDYNDIEWLDEQSTKPTLAELEAEANRLQQLRIDNQYQSKRAQNYPSITDQLDMLWHAMDDGTLPKVDSFYDAIKAVKDEYPKAQ